MTRFFAALCAGSAVLTLSSAAIGQEQQQEPQQLQPTAARTLQLSKVVLDTETSELVARVKGGTLCVFPSNVKIPKEKKTQNYERFDNLFSEAMKTRGFTVVSTSNDMFAGADDKDKADYLVGVTLRPTAMNLCSSVKGEKGDVAISAEWQIFDRAAGKVVDTVTTTAVGTQAAFATDGQKQMINQAFTGNLSAFVDKGVLQKYVEAVKAQ